MMLRELLKDKIPSNLLQYVPRSFDVIGSREKAVAIIEIPSELSGYEKIIAEGIMIIHRNVKSVLKKVGERKTEYRVREYELILGDPNTEVIHIEYGCKYLLDPMKVYFSPRESTERMRIVKKIYENEFIMLMFAGICPYGIMIAKHKPDIKKIVAIEINPYAYNYMIKNIVLNKVQDKIIPVLGDVRNKAEKWYGMCDRVIMPLPKGAYLFLDEAFQCLKEEGGIIHFYHWGHEEDLFSNAIKIIEKYGKKYGRRIEILEKRKVLPYAPRVYKVRVDFKVF